MTTYPECIYPPLLAQGQTWEQITAGSVFRTGARTITEADLITFVTWGGFSEPLFLEASHAAAGGQHRSARRGDHQEQRPQPARRGRADLHPGPADPRPRLPASRDAGRPAPPVLHV